MLLINSCVRQLKSIFNVLVRYNPVSYFVAAWIVRWKGEVQPDFAYYRQHPVIQISGINQNDTMEKPLLREMVSRSRKPLFGTVGYSSGTTNSPIKVYRSFLNVLLEEFFTIRYWRETGFRFFDSTIVLRGENLSIFTNKLYFFLPFENKCLFSSFDLSPDNASLLVDLFEKHQFKFVQAYPSSVYQLALIFQSIGYSPSSVRGVFTSSERWSDFDVELVESQIGSVFDHYGQAERVALLQSCRFKNYHVVEDYSYVEFLPSKNGLHEIVGTSFNNSAMPLWRYRTHDFVTSESQVGCPCGKSSRFVTNILGRSDDVVVLSDGSRIGRLDVAFKGLDNLFAAQIVQSKLNEIDVYCVPVCDSFHEVVHLKNEVARSLDSYFRGRIGITIHVVEDVKREPSGKFRSVKNLL